jgi:hypothetical protein
MDEGFGNYMVIMDVDALAISFSLLPWTENTSASQKFSRLPAFNTIPLALRNSPSPLVK